MRLLTRKLANTATLAEFDESIQEEIDTIWLMIGAILVFFMQTGYAMVEVGSVATKNPHKIFLKNLLDASLAAVLFGVCGYGLAFGDTSGEGVLYGWIGKDFFLFNKNDFEDGTGYNYASWLFQWAFAAFTSTIACGSMSERITFKGSLIFVFILIGIIYPPIVCAIWNSQGIGSSHREDGRLFGCGVLDFAGGGVVHMTGGISALVGAVMLGPRRSFLMNEAEISDFGPMFQTMGTLILWFGWYALNAVSSMHIVSYAEVGSRTMVMTTIGGAIGGFSGIIMSTLAKGKLNDGIYHIQFESFNRGVLAGLVSVSAGCSVMEPYGAALTGFVGAALQVYVSEHMNEWGIDDVMNIFSIHGVCGAFGLIMAGVLAMPHHYAQTYDSGRAGRCDGLLYGGKGQQLAANAVAVTVIAVWVSITTGIIFGALKYCKALRISEQLEDASMDISDHPALITSTPPTSIHDLVIPETSKPQQPASKVNRESRTNGGGRGEGGGRGDGGRGSKGGRGKVPTADGTRRASKIVNRNIEMTSSV